jgi:hypothetical protein
MELAVLAIPSKFPMNPGKFVAVDIKIFVRMSPLAVLSTKVDKEEVLLLESIISV